MDFVFCFKIPYFNCEVPIKILNWVNSTPFGRPVVPDEHKTNATLFFIFTALH